MTPTYSNIMEEKACALPTFVGITAQGARVPLGAPREAVFAFDGDAPADQVKAVFPVEERLPLFAELLIEEGDRPVFWGVVDEENTTLSDSGLWVELVARSREALLLDNEACPQPVVGPSLPKLMAQLLEPLGFSRFTGSGESAKITLEIEKGESCWQVLSRFCEEVLGVSPWVDGEGVVRCEKAPPREVVLSGVSQVIIQEKPCKEISQVWLQSFRGGYDTLYRQKGATARRRRYCSRQSGQDPKALLKEAWRESYSVTVETPGAVWPLRDAVVTAVAPGLGELARCPVRRGRVLLDEKGVRTRLTLERGEEHVAD